MGGDERKFANIQIKNLVPLLLKLPGTSEKETRNTNNPLRSLLEGVCTSLGISVQREREKERERAHSGFKSCLAYAHRGLA